MGCTDPPLDGVSEVPPSALISVRQQAKAIFLIYADVLFHIPMTQRNDRYVTNSPHPLRFWLTREDTDGVHRPPF